MVNQGHTARCNDGTYSDSQNCSGTCSGHGGVDVWYVSSCGHSRSARNKTVLSQPTMLSYALTNGQWAGSVRWHQEGRVKSGTMTLMLQDEQIIRGALVLEGDALDLAGNVEDGFFT